LLVPALSSCFRATSELTVAFPLAGWLTGGAVSAHGPWGGTGSAQRWVLQGCCLTGCTARTKPAPSWQLSLFLFLVVLSEGVFLPHISSFTYTDVSVVIHKVRNERFTSLPAMFDLKGARERRLPPGSRIIRSRLL